MKKIVFALLLLPYVLLAQYTSDGAAEKYYESSALHFKSNFLNPYGISGFGNIAKGFIQDPFLQVQVNPAIIPFLDTNNALVYFDFRGDKKKVELIEYTSSPVYYTDGYRIQPPGADITSDARTEPEPLFSVGTFFKPFKGIDDNLTMGFTYQYVQNDEPYYGLRNPQYYQPLYNDAFGVRVLDDVAVPTIDRQSATDEMSNEAHTYTLYAGYAFNEKLALGVSFSGISQEREGAYGVSNRSQYGTAYMSPYSYGDMDARSMKYRHTDISAGIVYKPRTGTMLGAKAGMLNGVSEQSFTKGSSTFMEYNTPEIDTNWNYYSSLSSTDQSWKHDGSSYYAGVNVAFALPGNRTFTAFYEYRNTKEDITNRTTFIDSSNSSYRYSYYYVSPYWVVSKSRSFTNDYRSTTGDKKTTEHEGVASMRWDVNDATRITLGFRFHVSDASTGTSEPVNSTRYSKWQSLNQSGSNQSSETLVKEDKIIYWSYDVKEWEMSIPVYLEHQFTSYLSCMLGVSREVRSRKIEESTLDVYNKRENVQDGHVHTETQFAERYKMPTEKITEKKFAIFCGANLQVGDNINIRVLLNPETEPITRVAQWSIGCNVTL